MANIYFCGIISKLLLAESLALAFKIRAEDPSLENVYSNMIPPIFKVQ
jgi:hypothetical protein